MPQVANLRELLAQTKGFGGGVNIRDAQNLIGPDELRRAENVVLDAKGGLSKRLGCANAGAVGASGDRILSSYTFYRGTAVPQVLIHTTAGNMYYTSDPTANPAVWTLITGGLSTTTPAAFETYNNMVFFAEGTVYASWSGSTYTTYPSAPKGIYLRVWKDAMWVSGVAGLPDRVYSSTPGDATTFPGSNWVDILHGDGDFVACLATDGLFLIVGKKKRIQVIYDPALLQNRTADYEKGMESHFGVIHMEDKLYFLSRLGICWWQGDASARLISYKIDSLFKQELINLGALGNVYGYQIADRCGWALPEAGQTYPTLTIEYYPRYGPIYQISGSVGPGPWVMHRFPATAFATFRSGQVEYLYAGATGANKLYRIFAPVGTDDGNTYTTTVETGFYDLGDAVNYKYLRRIKVIGRGRFYFQLKRNFNTAVYRTYLVDMTTATDVWGKDNWNSPGDTWGPDSYIKEKILNPDAYGRSFALIITDGETTVGTAPVPVGSHDVALTAGEWQFLEAVLDGQQLGLRG
jgi:hypothetical protein